MFLTKENLNTNSLGALERLKSKKIIASLFEKGSFFVCGNIAIKYLPIELGSSFPAQIGVSVPKSNFKRAVDRNLIKRRIKHAYRTNKHSLYQKLSSQNQQMAFMIMYRGKQINQFTEIEKDVKMIITKLMARI